MNKQEAGRRGGTSCKLRQGTDYVPLILMAGAFSQILQYPVETEYFSLQGSKGGSATFDRYGRAYMAALGRKGGRPRQHIES
jgi:general stress protein YciG